MRIDPSTVHTLTPQRVATWAGEDPEGTRALVQSPELWQAILAAVEVNIGARHRPPGWDPACVGPSSQLRGLRSRVEREGYAKLVEHVDRPVCGELAKAALTLCAQGWNAAFLALVDEAWQLASTLAAQIVPQFDGALHFAGELTAFCVTPSLPGAMSRGVPPHRDRFGSAAPDNGDAPSHLTCWISLTQASVGNGCMRVVPVHQDPTLLGHPDPWDPEDRGVAIETAPGTVLAWDGRILHWGGIYDPTQASGPRVALALSLTSVPPGDHASTQALRLPSFAQRLARVAAVMRSLHPPQPGSAMDVVVGLMEQPDEPVAPPPRRRPRASATDTRLDRAIVRGVDYLARDLDHHGEDLWRDHVGIHGSKGSNVWSSAFISAHIGRIDEGRELAASVARALLARRRPSGGWGYDENLLEDCDSTAWVLLAAAHAGVRVPPEPLVGALRFILSHQDPGGGFVTYGPAGQALFGDIAARAGWFTPQPCVTAAALHALATFAERGLPAIDLAARYLEDQRGPDELWQPYWWFGFPYATHHAVAALTQAGVPVPADRIARAVLHARRPDGGWAGAQPDHSNTFATAMALLTLMDTSPNADEPTHQAMNATLWQLLDAQRADGGFEPAAELRVPGGVTEQTLTVLDRGPFTTACVLHALDRARHVLAPAGDRGDLR